MNRMTITIEVELDPTLNDPHVLAEDVIGEYNDVGEGPEVRFVSAEWTVIAEQDGPCHAT